jgi:hypothetical protein
MPNKCNFISSLTSTYTISIKSSSMTTFLLDPCYMCHLILLLDYKFLQLYCKIKLGASCMHSSCIIRASAFYKYQVLQDEPWDFFSLIWKKTLLFYLLMDQSASCATLDSLHPYMLLLMHLLFLPSLSFRLRQALLTSTVKRPPSLTGGFSSAQATNDAILDWCPRAPATLSVVVNLHACCRQALLRCSSFVEL